MHKPDRFEYLTVTGGAILNILLWFWLLPATAGAIVAAVTSIGFALAMAEWFDGHDKRRAKIKDTSDQQEA